MKKLLLGLAGFALILNFAFAGYYIEQVTKTSRGGEHETVQRMWIQGPYTKIDSEKSIVIVDFNNQNAIIADKTKKTYFKISFQEMRQMMDRVFEMMKKMGMNLTPTIEITNQTKKIGNFKCTVVYISMGNFQKTEECLSKDVKIDFSAYLKAAEIMFPKDLAEAMRNKGKELSALGYPVYSKTTSSIMGQTNTSETILKTYKEENFPASVFTVPAGYVEKPAPQIQMPRR